mgnify:CR=1 FL=1
MENNRLNIFSYPTVFKAGTQKSKKNTHYFHVFDTEINAFGAPKIEEAFAVKGNQSQNSDASSWSLSLK